MMKNPGITVSGLIVAFLVLPDVRAQTCNPEFLITETPNGPGRNALNAVAAFDVNDVWAVGYSKGPNYQTLVEHWDGSSWSIVPSQNPAADSRLLGVGGAAPDDLWAVGYFSDNVVFSTRILTEHWDGAQWSVVPAPNLGGYERLNAVAAVAADDVWAVGELTFLDPLFLHWDGLAWNIVSLPADIPRQTAVVAIASDDVWSAGDRLRAPGLFNHWDGTSWTTVRNPPLGADFATIRGLSALAPNDIWAAGYLAQQFCYGEECYDTYAPRVLHWDGESWSIVDPPQTSDLGRLSGIAAPSNASVWSVGIDVARSFASNWDGSQWTNAPSLQLDGATGFEGVTAVGEDVWAVGWSSVPGQDRTLAVRYRCN